MKTKKLADTKYSDPRWQKKRLERFNAAGWKCQSCESETRTLHLHHAYYMPNRDLWDYPDWSLTCLCNKCHDETHNPPDGEEFVQPYWEIFLSHLMSGGSPEGMGDMTLDMACHLNDLPWDFTQRQSKLEIYLYAEKFCFINNIDPPYVYIDTTLLNRALPRSLAGLGEFPKGNQETAHSNSHKNATEEACAVVGGGGHSVY